MSFPAFTEGDTFATFKAHIDRVLSEIAGLEADYVLNASLTELQEHYAEQGSIDKLVLHPDDYHIIDRSGVKIDVSHDFRRAVFPGEKAEVQGTRLTVAVPYEGQDLLWNVRPSTFTLNSRHIDLRNGNVILTYSFPDDTAKEQQGLKTKIESDIAYLAGMVENLNNDIENHNREASGKVETALNTRRERALAVTQTIEGLGIPMKKREKPAAYVAPVKRRPRPVSRPTAAKEAFRPEPYLEEKEYEHILAVLRGMSHVIERAPQSFQTLDEESIRDHFLLQLNGHYDGSATGETFNASGKTDILIREKDRNIFIAECKFWHGPKKFDDAISQILSYLTWRDCKAAILVFNRNKDSAAVAEKMHEAVEARPEFRKTVIHAADSGDCRYIIVKKDEPGREIVLTTQIYDVPSSAD